MFELVFYKGPQRLFRFHIDQQETKIGRDPQCDISLPDPDISRLHTLLALREGRLTLIDRSRNGTYVNGKPVREAVLKPADEIQIGAWTIRFVETEVLAGEETVVPELQGTSIPIQVTLTPLQGPPQIYTFYKSPIHLGPGPSSDVRLEGGTTKVWVEGKKLFIRDLGSPSGIFFKGDKLREALLKSGDVVRVGDVELRLEILTEKGKTPVSARGTFQQMIGQGARMKEVFGLIEKVAMSDHAVMVTGETGTGKELVAHAIHKLSPRSGQPFVVINCGAISPQLIESEIFGHEKGSFTGATARREGAFEQADGGTLFLDEIGELPLDLQPKILRVLEGKSFKRVGGSADIEANVRVIAATHRNLGERVQKGAFREDLYFRLYVVPIALPALRERVEDLPPLVDYFLGPDGNGLRISAEALKVLQAHHWPGNIRELKNVLIRSVLLAPGPVLGVRDIQFLPQEASLPKAEENDLEQLERHAIANKLKECRWNKKRAAEQLGIAKSTLFKKIKKYDLKPD